MPGLLTEKWKCKQIVSVTERRGLNTLEQAYDLYAVHTTIWQKRKNNDVYQPHSMLNCHGIVQARRKPVVIMSFSWCEALFETTGRVASEANPIAVLSPKFLQQLSVEHLRPSPLPSLQLYPTGPDLFQKKKNYSILVKHTSYISNTFQ